MDGNLLLREHGSSISEPKEKKPNAKQISPLSPIFLLFSQISVPHVLIENSEGINPYIFTGTNMADLINVNRNTRCYIVAFGCIL